MYASHPFLTQFTVVLQIFNCKLHDTYITEWIDKELRGSNFKKKGPEFWWVFFLKALSYLQSGYEDFFIRIYI